MTFTANEGSIESGAPIELYEFNIGSESFQLTSAEDELVVESVTYDPVEVRRSSINLGPDERNDVLEVTLPSTHAFARKYIDIVPGQAATLTIKRFHRFDTDVETAVIFKGQVRSVAFSLDGRTARIAVLPITAALGRSVPRFTYQGLCNHILYDPRCKVTPGLFRHQDDVTAVSTDGTILTVQGLGAMGDDWSTAGYVTLNGIDHRLILDQTGDDITIRFPFGFDVLNQTVDVFAGCDHSGNTCKTKFNNVVNYGGHAFVPLRNIFATGIS